MNDTLTISKTLDERIDALEVELLKNEIDCEVVHEFTPGLYSREILMPESTFVVSKIHKTEHQYCVLRGAAYVRVNDDDWVYIEAPFVGITKAGTRRVLYIVKTCSWITFHPTNRTTVEEVEMDIIEPRINSVLGMELKNYKLLQDAE